MSVYSKEFIDRTIRAWQKNDGEERETKREKNEGNKLLQTHEEVPSVPKMFGSAVPSGPRSREESRPAD